MGEVFLAEDHQLERKVALKFLPDGLTDDPVARKRFEREAKAAASLDHPFICKIHEIAETDGRTCIVIEHVSGRTLDRVIADGPTAPKRTLEIAAEVVEALEEAHARRILHRDLKPSDLMLTEQGHVKVMDFGLAKRIPERGQAESQGTTQARSRAARRLSAQRRIWRLSRFAGSPPTTGQARFRLASCCTSSSLGSHPCRKEPTSDTLAAILRDPPTPPSGGSDPTTYSIFQKLLAKDPNHRYGELRRRERRSPSAAGKRCSSSRRRC